MKEITKEELEKELFELEQQLDIPHKDRYYNKDDKRNTPKCGNCYNLKQQLEKEREDNDSLKKTIDKMHIFMQSLP